MGDFWDRQDELSRIKQNLGKGAFGYVTGRRRIGKTGLLKRACQIFGGLYHQAIEGNPAQQLEHLVLEWRHQIPIFQKVQPKTWQEFFALLENENLPPIVVVDELPYWVNADPSLSSILQKWVDHELPKKKTLLLVSGSSQSMLYSQFLKHASPLYGRARLHLHLEPISYHWFCRAMGYKQNEMLSFTRFSLVGGIPHYWKLLPSGSLLSQVERLYFEPSAILAEEPKLILHDEGITGNLPKSILDLVGRGVNKPSELAARTGVPQGNLSRPLALLLELGLLQREIPFGESIRSTKKVLYRLHDAALSFYYGTYLVHRSRWLVYSQKEKEEILRLHTSRQWELFCRQCYPGSGRYWGKNIEIDLITPLAGKKHLVAECKWIPLDASREGRILDDLKTKFHASELGKKIRDVRFAVLSPVNLPKLASGKPVPTAEKGDKL